MAIELNKIGMEVEDVMYGIQGSGTSPATMMEIKREKEIGINGSLQLFKTPLEKKVAGNCTFVFRICIKGTHGYSYQLSDRLAKSQLWAAFKNQQNLADVEFVVKDKIFPAQKAILAARNEEFADEFSKEQPVREGRHQIRLDGVEPSTVEKFLHFIYTGETMGTLADEELLKLAHHYELTTLENLCQNAVRKIETMQMTKFMASLYSGSDALSSSRIMPEKDTEIFFDGTTPTFRCELQFDKWEMRHGPYCVMEYQKEYIFFVYFSGYSDYGNPNQISRIHFSCDKHQRFGLQVEDIYFNLDDYCNINPAYGHLWFKMEETRFKKQTKLLHFTAPKLHTDINDLNDAKRHDSKFDVKFISTIGNYYYEMMDDKWLKNFWAAASDQIMTDVEIFVGTVKVMEVHRVILCARSPVLNESLSKISNTAGKPIVTLGVEFDVDIVKNFLNFLYTGSLKTTEGAKQLSKLATIYQVETLKNVCKPFQLFNANPMDGMNVEELTDYLLQL